MRVVALALGLSACVGIPPAADPGGDAGSDADADACVDGDGDGYLPPGCLAADPLIASDCADDDGSRHPGALETCGDSIDQDCDNVDLECADALIGNDALFASDRVTVVNGVLAAAWAEAFSLSGLATAAAPATNLLYAGPNEERLSGMLTFDRDYSWDPLVTPTVETIASGLATTRFSVEWSTAGLQGTTIFTVFPDGRVHRDEDFEVRTEGADLFLTAYVSLDHQQFTHVDWTVDATGPYEIAGFTGGFDFFFSDTTGSGEGTTCAYDTGADRALAFGWLVPPTPAPLGPRATQGEANLDPLNRHVALQYDWQRGGVLATGSYRGDFVLRVEPSTLGNCASLATAVRALHRPLGLAVSGGALVLGGTGDDDADGFNDGGGFWQVSLAAELSTTLTFSTEAGTRQASPNAAIRLAGLSPFDPTVSIAGEPLVRGRDYHLQRESDGSVYLFIARPLADSVVTLRGPR